MVDFKKLAGQAKHVIDERGGMDSVKADAEELKDIAAGKGSATDKLKAAAEALREPGAPGAGDSTGAAGSTGA